MKIIIVVAAITLLLSGCALTGALDFFKPSKGVEVSAQVGKTNNQEKNALKLENKVDNSTTQEADTISNKEETVYENSTIENITKSLDPLELALLVVLAGVALPSWKELYTGVKVVLGDTYQALTFPLREVGRYLLKLFGKD